MPLPFQNVLLVKGCGCFVAGLLRRPEVVCRLHLALRLLNLLLNRELHTALCLLCVLSCQPQHVPEFVSELLVRRCLVCPLLLRVLHRAFGKPADHLLHPAADFVFCRLLLRHAELERLVLRGLLYGRLRRFNRADDRCILFGCIAGHEVGQRRAAICLLLPR